MAASVLPSSGSRSDISRSHSTRGGRPVRSHSPCHALPLHLQDPNYPRLRRRYPSALSTHSHDINASVPTTPTSPFIAHQQQKSKPRSHTYFVFPPPKYSPISSQSSSPMGWVNSPNPTGHWSNPPSHHPDSHSQGTRSHSMDLLRPSTLPLRPPSIIESRRKSCDILELESHPPKHHRHESPLSAVRSLDVLEVDHPTGKRGTYGDISPALPTTPSGHTPCMRLSFDTLDRRGNTRRRSSRRPYHVVHPISTNMYQNVIIQDPALSPYYPRHTDIDSAHNGYHRYSQPVGHMTTGHMTKGASSSSLLTRPPEVNNWYDGSETSLCTSSCTGQQYSNNNNIGKRGSGYLTPVISGHNSRPVSMHSHYQFRRELRSKSCDVINCSHILIEVI